MPMIKCTDEQAYLMELCLDTMCRASMGQLAEVITYLMRENADVLLRIDEAYLT